MQMSSLLCKHSLHPMQTALILQLGTRLAQEQMLEHLSKHEFVDCSVNNTFAGMEMKVDRLRWSLDQQGQHNYKKTRAQISQQR